MIIEKNGIFVMHTKNTTYAFAVLESGQLEHLYYGKRIRLDDNLTGAAALVEQHAFAPGNSINYDQNSLCYTLEDVCLEMSSLGKGDIREPFVSIVHSDGSRTSDFVYESYSIKNGKSGLKTLPASYGSDEEVMELVIKLVDKQYNIGLELRYAAFYDCDVITRSAVLTNDSESEISVRRLMSGQLDMQGHFKVSSFDGAWAREMNMVTQEVKCGKYVSGSMTGTSSNRCNPFHMISSVNATEDTGNVYGINLIYSGNHFRVLEMNAYGKLRALVGIQPEGFEYCLEPGESLEAPEAVYAFSDQGYNGMSQCMHSFVREHIVRGVWKNKLRPVLLNSWEAAYFDISESRLVRLAKAAQSVGIELFVMDDGWFGERNDDAHSLGDWYENVKKLPGGLGRIAEKVNALGLDFGIWVEPEMVNVNSHLYEEHPDWCLAIPDRPHSEGRNQRILDLCNIKVQDYVIDAMKKVFSSANISYVKWDMNRIISDCFSPALPAKRQGEVAHRYVMGLYRVADELTRSFPNILFEGCASGGNRFDLGMLCYFPQIWGSDNTDALCRARIQTGYSYAYPPETVGAHVSGCPNHQTLRRTPLESRFAIAAFGSLGYECNLADMSGEELDAIKAQIELYKANRAYMQFGSFYRGRTLDEGNICEWTVVSGDKSHAVGMLFQSLVEPNTQYQYYRAAGLNPEVMYSFTNRKLKYNIKDFGDLVNTVAPIHVKQDSFVHNTIARFVKLDGETEEYVLYGDQLMNAGVKLKQAFGGTGYNDQVRPFPDFAARMYFMEQQ